MARSAPWSIAKRRFFSEPAIAMTLPAPSARAIWMLVDPTPPAAAVTSTVSPRRMRATSASAWKAVNATSG